MGVMIAEIHLDGSDKRKRWPWWQMVAGDWFDVVARAEFEADAIRNTLASSAAGMAKRTKMRFMQRRIDPLRVRVYRVDGHTFGDGMRETASYVGSDPVKLAPMKSKGIRRFSCATDAEYEFTLAAVHRSAAYLTDRSSATGGEKTFEVRADGVQRSILVICSDPKEDRDREDAMRGV